MKTENTRIRGIGDLMTVNMSLKLSPESSENVRLLARERGYAPSGYIRSLIEREFRDLAGLVKQLRIDEGLDGAEPAPGTQGQFEHL